MDTARLGRDAEVHKARAGNQVAPGVRIYDPHIGQAMGKRIVRQGVLRIIDGLGQYPRGGTVRRTLKKADVVAGGSAEGTPHQCRVRVDSRVVCRVEGGDPARGDNAEVPISTEDKAAGTVLGFDRPCVGPPRSKDESRDRV